MRLDTTHVNKRKHDPKLGLLSFLFNHVNSTMPAGVNCRTTTAATAKGKEKCKKANTLPNKHVQSTGHAPAAKQKQVAAQPEKQEESSEEEQSGNEEGWMKRKATVKNRMRDWTRVITMTRMNSHCGFISSL